MAREADKSCVDIEAGPHRPSSAGESGCGGRVSVSDADDQSWHSPCRNSPCDEFRCLGSSSHEIDVLEEDCRGSCISDCLSEVDLECGSASEIKGKKEGDCRICHLSLETRDSGVPIVLGCSCKNDLAAAHKQCAETWFKIRGNKTCEICGSIAKNMVNPGDAEYTEQTNETNSINVPYAASSETRRFWQGHRFLNFLLACMIFAFVISWLFHFNLPG